MSHLCTTRKGLFLNFKTKLLDGKFFGLARHESTWYVFGTDAEDIQKPTYEGYILRFKLDRNGTIYDQERVIENLDNGVHQILVHDGHLYIVETYLQKITKVSLEDFENVETILPMNPSVSAWYVFHGMDAPSSAYVHMNALTVQDDRFYISCPKLRNKLGPDGMPTQDRSPTIIKVFSKDWKQIDEINTKRFFCHDLVILRTRDLLCRCDKHDM
jgi:hypothetical protein